MYDILSNPVNQIWIGIVLSFLVAVLLTIQSSIFIRVIITTIAVSPVFVINSYAGQHALIVAYGIAIVVSVLRFSHPLFTPEVKGLITAAILFHIAKDLGYTIDHLQRTVEVTGNRLHDMLILTDVLEFSVFTFLVLMKQRE